MSNLNLYKTPALLHSSLKWMARAIAVSALALPTACSSDKKSVSPHNMTTELAAAPGVLCTYEAGPKNLELDGLLEIYIAASGTKNPLAYTDQNYPLKRSAPLHLQEQYKACLKHVRSGASSPSQTTVEDIYNVCSMRYDHKPGTHVLDAYSRPTHCQDPMYLLNNNFSVSGSSKASSAKDLVEYMVKGDNASESVFLRDEVSFQEPPYRISIAIKDSNHLSMSNFDASVTLPLACLPDGAAPAEYELVGVYHGGVGGVGYFLWGSEWYKIEYEDFTPKKSSINEAQTLSKSNKGQYDYQAHYRLKSTE